VLALRLALGSVALPGLGFRRLRDEARL
jgi:hypothetical protein